MEATRETAEGFRFSRLGLFGIRFTVQGRFYPDIFSKAGISLIVPQEDEQAYIDEKYMNELVNGVFLPETRDRLLTIADRLAKQEHVQGLILAGTELPLILRDSNPDIPLLDTTQIHVKAAINALLS